MLEFSVGELNNGRKFRNGLDVGCGVASFRAYLKKGESTESKQMDQEDNLNHYNDDVNDIENEGLIDVKEIERCWSDKSMACREPLLTKRKNTTSQIAIVGANICPIESLDYE
ncbi:hypothetical protein U1Q18_008014 [Sarracenia purpurea var. burkii]